MTSEPVEGVVFGRLVVGKMTLSYICLPFHSPTQASQPTRTSSYYRFRCHYPLITYLNPNLIKIIVVLQGNGKSQKNRLCSPHFYLPQRIFRPSYGPDMYIVICSSFVFHSPFEHSLKLAKRVDYYK